MFTHLHVHTEFSMLDGLSRLDPLVRRAKELGMGSLAITDHGGMYGAIDFYRIAKEHGVKPIIGCEMYVAPGSRHGREREDKNPYHLTVLAQDAQGYGNLIKLVTSAHLEGFYYKPRIDRELLEQHRQGLIVMSGCPSGEVPKALSEGRLDDARAAADWYRELLDGRYFLELMEHDSVDQLPEINRGLMDLTRELDIPVVGTNDSHYVVREDAHLQDILICIHTNTNINDAGRLKMEDDSYYLKSHDEMAALFSEVPEAVTNTERIAEMCDLDMDFSQLRLPQYQVPDGRSADEYLVQVCRDGLRRRIERVTEAEEQRLAYELEVIRQTQFANYFLVVWDIARFVRERDIFFAVRGSAAASLVLFCLGVTNINPLPYRLVFERFLNVERKEMPDIDMDFQDDRREEVINYVVSKYGRDHVAQIITFGTLGARASIRDVGRALGMAYADVDRVARLIPFRLHITLDDAVAETDELRDIYENDDATRKLVDTARSLEGLTRHSSTHAAGVVISEEPLKEIIPLQSPIRGEEHGVAMTQYAMEPCAALGLLKMDFLGLANLAILARARDLIAQTRGIELVLNDIPLDDPATFALLAKGETVGVFQLEGSGMTRYIKDLKPSSLADVAAMIALYRPGPMEHISTFIEAKHGNAEAQYPHPALKDILEETYGVIVYQDQVLLIAQTFAGYTLGEADIVRKAMGKKVPEIMAQERDKFITGALEQGYSQDVADKVFALIEPFAGYAFNKAHSVSYGIISYWTAYLKANYPAEYMVALLNSYIDNTEKVSSAVAECRRLGIPVLPPSINHSEAGFSIGEGTEGQQAIRFGLTAVKNVGSGALGPVLAERDEAGGFTSVEHMSRTADMSGLNRKTLESLIKAGALDEFGDRGALLEVVERILSLSQSEARLRDSNQASMFEQLAETVPAQLVQMELADLDTPLSELQAWEAELIGVPLSGNEMLDRLVAGMGSDVISLMSQIDPGMNKRKVTVAGRVTTVTERVTRDGKPFLIVSLALLDGPIEVFVWDEVRKVTEGIWREGSPVAVVGTVRYRPGRDDRARDDQPSIGCLEASLLTASDETTATRHSSTNEPPEAAVATPKHPNGTTSDQSAPAEALAPAHHSGTTSDSPAPAEALAPTHTNGKTTDQSTPPTEALEPAHANGKTEARETAPAETVQRLVLRMSESDEASQDAYMLDDVLKMMLEFRGDDEVSLQIAAQGHVFTMEWPMVRVRACAELAGKLSELLADAGNARVEAAAST